jgi:hypothetical protein
MTYYAYDLTRKSDGYRFHFTLESNNGDEPDEATVLAKIAELAPPLEQEA